MRAGDRSGFALIMTLWVMIFLIVVVTSFALTSKWSMTSTINFQEETKAYYLALSGYDLAIAYLMNDRNLPVDFSDEEGSFYVDTEHDPPAGSIPLYGGTVEITLTDELARFNINMLSPDKMRNLLRHAGLEDDRVDEAVDSLIDWIDPDDLHHLKGAEDEYYRELGYVSKDRPLDTVEELLLVKGFSDDLVFGSDKYKALASLVTVYGNNALNVNTVTKDTLTIAGVSQVDIDMIMRYRNKSQGGLSQVPSNLFPFGLNVTSSPYVRIEVSAASGEGRIRYGITAVVKRIPVAKGYRVETIAWREHVRYS